MDFSKNRLLVGRLGNANLSEGRGVKVGQVGAANICFIEFDANGRIPESSQPRGHVVDRPCWPRVQVCHRMHSRFCMKRRTLHHNLIQRREGQSPRAGALPFHLDTALDCSHPCVCLGRRGRFDLEYSRRRHNIEPFPLVGLDQDSVNLMQADGPSWCTVLRCRFVFKVHKGLGSQHKPPRTEHQIDHTFLLQKAAAHHRL
mmetsp:Transcript_41/g.64  ORF Transcript_41/g.64 Transcript_41/m.64 type:complete len:201 (-) Transcript_41:588-1190(-)